MPRIKLPWNVDEARNSILGYMVSFGMQINELLANLRIAMFARSRF